MPESGPKIGETAYQVLTCIATEPKHAKLIIREVAELMCREESKMRGNVHNTLLRLGAAGYLTIEPIQEVFIAKNGLPARIVPYSITELGLLMLNERSSTETT